MLEQDTILSFSTVDVLRSGSVEGVLAMIVAVDGPSYRPLGAVMRFFADGTSVGTLSSGCIEADLALHASEALESAKACTVRYGRGSPYMDIQLPCGGGLEVILLPRPCEKTLSKAVMLLEARKAVSLGVDITSGALSISVGKQIRRTENEFYIHYMPEPKFIVLGKGPEAATFAALTETLGYPNILLSPDGDTLGMGGDAPDRRIHLSKPELPSGMVIDPWSAVLLFFHDHDWEPPILLEALQSRAFYIGAQGSQRARQQREIELEKAGATIEQLQRIRGPIGLIPSARDARTLAVSVLAEVLKERVVSQSF